MRAKFKKVAPMIGQHDNSKYFSHQERLVARYTKKFGGDSESMFHKTIEPFKGS